MTNWATPSAIWTTSKSSPGSSAWAAAAGTEKPMVAASKAVTSMGNVIVRPWISPHTVGSVAWLIADLPWRRTDREPLPPRSSVTGGDRVLDNAYYRRIGRPRQAQGNTP